MTPHPANYSKVLRQLEHIADLAGIAANLTPAIWPRICDGINGQPSAQNTDSSGGRQTVTDDRGDPMPALTDPTGEATTRRDPAYQDIRELRRICSRMHTDIERLVVIYGRHQKRQANLYEAEHTADGDPGCRSCSRLPSDAGTRPKWEPVHQATNLNGERVELCRWCYEWVRSTGTLPDRKTLTDHHDGKRIRRPA